MTNAPPKKKKWGAIDGGKPAFRRPPFLGPGLSSTFGQQAPRGVTGGTNRCYAHNQLADAAKDAGVIDPVDYAVFQNFGYQGLYGGLDAKAIHRRKQLKKNQHILDHMGSTELAANLFRATQTEEKLRRENIRGKSRANQTHYDVGKKVRQTIKELGGTMPEELPTEESIKKLEGTEQKKMGGGK